MGDQRGSEVEASGSYLNGLEEELRRTRDGSEVFRIGPNVSMAGSGQGPQLLAQFKTVNLNVSAQYIRKPEGLVGVVGGLQHA